MTPLPPIAGPGSVMQRHLVSSTNEGHISLVKGSIVPARALERGQRKEADKDRAEAQSSSVTELSWGGAQEEMRILHQPQTWLQKRGGSAQRHSHCLVRETAGPVSQEQMIANGQEHLPWATKVIRNLE